MGREWYNWGSGGGGDGKSTSKRGSNNGGRSRGGAATSASNTSTFSTTNVVGSTNNAPIGCMCAVFQLFDFHQFRFVNFHHHHDHHHEQRLPPRNVIDCKTDTPFLVDQQELCIPKGTEAPRNSLELDQESTCSSTVTRKDDNFKIPMGIRIKTKHTNSTQSTSDSPSEIITFSPGTSKTPNLVARLMGLDILPEQCPSPMTTCSSSSSKYNFKSKKPIHSHRRSVDGAEITGGTRSLPETPRISSARRSDVDHYRHYSLQINNENVNEELSILARISSLRRLKNVRQQEEQQTGIGNSKSPVRYAGQLVKQVKESVSRKSGLADITNMVRDREEAEQPQVQQKRRDNDLIVISQLKSSANNANNKKLSMSFEDDNNSFSSSWSPRIRFLEPKNRTTTTVTSTKDNDNNKNGVSLPTKPSLSTTSHDNNNNASLSNQKKEQMVSKKSKKVNINVDQQNPTLLKKKKKPLQSSDIIKNKQEEPFVTNCNIHALDKKCKKTPLSNDLLSLLPLRKDPTTAATKIPSKQVTNAQESKLDSELPSYSSQSYKAVKFGEIVNGGATNKTAAAALIVSEREYVTRILKRIGIGLTTPVSFSRWLSASRPLDPSIFYLLEYSDTNNYLSGQLGNRCNRKLLFDLVNEFLVEISRPYVNSSRYGWETSAMGTTRRRDNSGIKGSELIDALCLKIRSFPGKDCRDLEDIDALIEKDLPQLKMESNQLAFGQEGENVVKEIHTQLFNMLIHETTLIAYDIGHRF